MSMQKSRRDRRAERGPARLETSQSYELPGPLRFLSNRRVFAVVSLIFGAGVIFSLLFGVFGNTSNPTGDNSVRQANEAPDAPREAQGTTTPDTSATPVAAKRYTAPPPMSIDPSKTYLATLKTSKGDIQVQLFPQQAPEAVNAFVFLARDGYYDGTPFMELVKNRDGSRFTAQAGDPTRTGLGTPGFSVKKEQTSLPFEKGAVGMGGTAENSNGGQFFISYGDYPALNGKYTIFGRVISGQGILDSLNLLDLTDKDANRSGDQIQAVAITEQ